MLPRTKNNQEFGCRWYLIHIQARAFVTPPSKQKTDDGLRAISGDTTGAIKVWDLNTTACIRTFPGHEGHGTNVQALALSQDGLKVRRGTGASPYYTLAHFQS